MRGLLHELRRIGGPLTSAKQISVPTSLNIGTAPNLANNVEDALRELNTATGMMSNADLAQAQQLILYYREGSGGGTIPPPTATWNGSSYDNVSPWNTSVPNGSGTLWVGTALATRASGGTWSTGTWSTWAVEGDIDRAQSRQLVMFRRVVAGSTPTAPISTFNGSSIVGDRNDFSETVPAGTNPLWVAYAVASRAAGGNWTTSTWQLVNGDNTALGQIQFSNNTNGPWSNTTSTTGFVRFRTANGGFTGAIPIGNAFQPWTLLGNTAFSGSATGSMTAIAWDLDGFNDIEIQVQLLTSFWQPASTSFVRVRANSISVRGAGTAYPPNNTDGFRIHHDIIGGTSLTTSLGAPTVGNTANETSFQLWFRGHASFPGTRRIGDFAVGAQVGAPTRVDVWGR